MWTRITIKQNERGLVTREGQLTGWLEPGVHTLWTLFSAVEVARIDLAEGFATLSPELRCVLPEGAGEELFVGPDKLALVERDGLPWRVLGPGRYVLWQQRESIRASVVDTRALLTEVPEAFWDFVPRGDLNVVTVKPFQRALLYVNGELASVLGPGRHGVSATRRQIEINLVDLREQEIQINGQEVITRDKVSIRTNLIIKYRVTDPVLSVQATTGLFDMLYSEAQMAARNLIGAIGVDELLEGRHQAAALMREAVSPRALGWGIEILCVDLKDIVLPGDMKTILNRVIEAEKQAAANLILRREETAATRSLANTAKVLQNNPVLMRLKEIEAIKEIADRIDQITVVAGGQDLARLLPALPNKG